MQTRNKPSKKKGTKKTVKVSKSISPVKPTIKAPVSQTRQILVVQPKVITQNQKLTIVKNRELITTLVDLNVYGQGFRVASRLRINPGSTLTFPWLSSIALGFENYRFRKLHFHYLPRCSTNTNGAVILSPDYDAADSQPTTEIKVSQNIGTTEDAVWKEQILKVDPARMNRAYKSHFVMSDTRFADSKQDEKTIDAAQVFVCQDTAGVNYVWGKLWCDYEVELMNPQTVELNPIGGSINQQLQSVENQLITGQATNLQADLLSTTNIARPSNGIGQMLKDFKGIYEMTISGGSMDANVAKLPGLKVNNDEIIPTGGAFWGPGVQPPVKLTFPVDLKKGDILSMRNPANYASNLFSANGILALANLL